MVVNDLWEAARLLSIRTGPEIVGGFDVGFDDQIPEETKDAIIDFLYWVEDHYDLPVTLWVDFKYRHYLVDKNKKRVGYKFYWADFTPTFENPDDIPVIELPVRTEHWTVEEILASFIEAISQYFMWLTNTPITEPNQDEIEEVLQAYTQRREKP